MLEIYSNNMEVEVKAKVDNLDEIKDKLKSLGASFGEVKREEDFYYKIEGEIHNFEPGSFTLRVRDSIEEKSLTYKAFTNRYGIWDEHKVEIDNIEEMKRILEKAKFSLAYTVCKERLSGKLNEFSFNLDKVKGLGNYIEVELISNDAKKDQEKIKDFLRSLGIKDNQFERRGYPEIIAGKDGFHSHGQK